MPPLRLTCATPPVMVRLPIRHLMSQRRLLVLAALFVSPVVARAAEPTVPTERPKLAVIISVDQLRGDYLTKFRPYFGEGGFKRLLDGGAEFRDTHYRHSITQTAPGHATILTGVHANVHGVTSKADTVGDMLKARYGTDSKVFAASNKDRSAILLGGRKGDAAYWDENGKMVTSRHYREKLPAWVEAFNAERRAQQAFGQTWDRIADPKLYDQLQGPDDAVGEYEGNGFKRTMPKTVTGGKGTITPAFFEAFDVSPFSAEFLGAFVERAVKEEKLGRNRATDVLGVSFSQIDSCGHMYGPDSHEIMDSMLRLDRVLARLLDTIDREVGLAHCLIVITADHGVLPVPEQTQAKLGPDAAGRTNLSAVDAAIKQALDAAYGPLGARESWFVRDNSGYHLRPAALAAKNVTAAEAAKIARDAMAALPYMAEVYSREELLAIDPNGTSVASMMRRSYRAESDRDLVFVLKAFFMPGSRAVGTTHGSPYAYDTHVGHLWYGPGILPAVRGERVGVDDIAPTLAGLLGVPVPNNAPGRRLL
jgi:predicted AlkP superfamily pyrophosphatase or phosphodiesterase